MCGRYALFKLDNLSSRFMVDGSSLDWSADYNISPGSMAPVITKNSPLTVRVMKWGLIPRWSKEFKMTFKTFNARREGLQQSKLFAPLLKSNRCLIPANGFYEWTQNNGKEPHYIQASDQETFSFAGLYDVWTDAEGMEFYSYTIITTAANAFMKPIHHRMPVMLDKKDEEIWLDSSMGVEQALLVLHQYRDDKLGEHKVDKKVGNSRHNSPDLIRPV